MKAYIVLVFVLIIVAIVGILLLLWFKHLFKPLFKRKCWNCYTVLTKDIVFCKKCGEPQPNEINIKTGEK